MGKVLKTTLKVAGLAALTAAAFGFGIPGAPLLITAGPAAGLTAATTLVSAGALGLVGSGLLFASSLFPGKKPQQDVGADQGTLLRLQKDPTAPRRVLYGKSATAGNMVYQEALGADNSDLYVVIALAGHEITSFDAFEFGGEVVTFTANNADGKFADKMFLYEHLGADGQAADGTLDAASSKWTSAHRLRGISYAVLKLVWDQELFPQGFQNPKFELSGRKLYDPRLDSANGGSGAHRLTDQSTWAWSENPVLCLVDYLRGIRVANSSASSYDGRLIAGLGIADARFDWANIRAEADVAEEQVALKAGGTIDRYSCNGWIDPSRAHKTNVEAILSSCAGVLVFQSGLWRIYTGTTRTAAKARTTDHLVGGVSLQTKKSIRDKINSVRGVYPDAAAGFEAKDFPPRQNAAFITEDGGEELWLDLNLPMTTSGPTAQRLANIALGRARLEKTASLAFNLTALQDQCMDSVTFTHAPLNLSAQKFLIADWSLKVAGDGAGNPGLVVEEVLVEEDDAIYDWTAASDEVAVAVPDTQTRVDTNQPDALLLVNAPAEAGANVTETRTAAAIADQGALATQDVADFASQVDGAEKPADNADVTLDNPQPLDWSTNFAEGAVVDTLFVQGSGFNSTNRNHIVRLSGVNELNTGGRGFRLTLMKRSSHAFIDYRDDGTGGGTLGNSQLFDTHGVDADRLKLRDALSEIRTNANSTHSAGEFGEDVIIIITSEDSWLSNSTNGDLMVDELKLHGASEIIRQNAAVRIPYLLIGLPNLGTGKGIEIITDAAVGTPKAQFESILVDGNLEQFGTLNPAEAGADETASNTAAGIDDQGDLATLNSADFATQVEGAEKPANNATVGAKSGSGGNLFKDDGSTKVTEPQFLNVNQEWDEVQDTAGFRPEDNADKTGDNTAADTTLVSGKPSSDVAAETDEYLTKRIRETITVLGTDDGKWVRLYTVTGAAGRHAARVAFGGSGGNIAPSYYILEITVDWAANAKITILATPPGGTFQAIRVVNDTVLDNVSIDVQLPASIGGNTNFRVDVNPYNAVVNDLVFDGTVGVVLNGDEVVVTTISNLVSIMFLTRNSLTGQEACIREDGSIDINGIMALNPSSEALALLNQGALATLNSADFATQVEGAEKPANNATLGADWGTNLASRPGHLTDNRIPDGLDGSGDLLRNITTARRDSSNLLGRSSGGLYTGALAATAGATWGVDLGSRPVELTDGRITLGLTSGGNLAKDILVARANTSNLLRFTGGALFSGDTDATLGAVWGTNISARPVELTDGRIADGLDSSGDLNRDILLARADSSDLLRRTSGGLFTGELAADVTDDHAQNFIINPNFEAGVLDWTNGPSEVTIENDAGNAFRGDWVMKFAATGALAWNTKNSKRNATKAGERWFASCMIKGGAAGGDAFVKPLQRLSNGSGTGLTTINLDVVPASGGYLLSRGIFEVTGSHVTVEAGISSDAAVTGTWYADQFILVPLPKDSDIDVLLTTNAPTDAGATFGAQSGSGGNLFKDDGFTKVLEPDFLNDQQEWGDVNDATGFRPADNATVGGSLVRGTEFNTLNEWFSSGLASTVLTSPWAIVTGLGGPAGDNALQIIDNDDFSENVFSERRALNPNKTYRVSVFARQPSGDRRNYLFVSFYKANGDRIDSSSSPVTDAVGWPSLGSFHYFWANTAFTTSWVSYNIVFGPASNADATIPTDAAFMQIGGLLAWTGTISTTVQLQELRVDEIDSRALDGLTSGGNIRAGVLQEQAAGGDSRILTLGMTAGEASNGDLFTFSPARQNIPLVKSDPGGRQDAGGLSGVIYRSFKAINLSVSGFTMELLIKETVGGGTLRTDGGAVTGGAQDFEIHKLQAAEAFDDNYLYQWDWTAAGGGTPSEPEPGMITVGLFTDDGVGGWIQRGSDTLVANGDQDKVETNKTESINVDGLGQHAGREFGLSVVSTTGPGGSLDGFDNVKYTTAGAPNTVTATPADVPKIPFTIFDGEESSVS